MVTTGGIHGLYIICQALLEPGDEVIIPDPEWPPCAGNIQLAQGVPVPCPLHESLGWRYDLDELASKITPKTRAIYLNSPHNPTGGVLTRDDIEAIAALAGDAASGSSPTRPTKTSSSTRPSTSVPASLPGMYERTISLYTFSKTYAMTGLRLGYVAAKDAQLRDRMKKVLFYTASNIASVVQFGGIGALEGSQDARRASSATSCRRGATCSTTASATHAGDVFSGEPPRGAFYAFLRINPEWTPPAGTTSESRLVGDDRVPDLEGTDRLRARRGLRRQRRRLSAVLFRARPPGADRRARVDEDALRLENAVRVPRYYAEGWGPAYAESAGSRLR